MKHLLAINGLEGPLARILGCDCGRCMNLTRQVHTSACKQDVCVSMAVNSTNRTFVLLF